MLDAVEARFDASGGPPHSRSGSTRADRTECLSAVSSSCSACSWSKCLFRERIK